MIPFDVETVSPTSMARIRKDSDCHFKAHLEPDERRHLRRLEIDPHPFEGGIEPRAAIEGLSRETVYVGACGDIAWGDREGWLSFEDFSRLRRIVYTHAKAAGCHVIPGSVDWPWHRRCLQATESEGSH